MVPEFESLEQVEKLAKKLIVFSQKDDTKHLEYGIYLDGKLIGFVNDCGQAFYLFYRLANHRRRVMPFYFALPGRLEQKAAVSTPLYEPFYCSMVGLSPLSEVPSSASRLLPPACASVRNTFFSTS